MSDELKCPDCGHLNPAGSASCTACNFPLTADAPAPTTPPAEEPETQPEDAVSVTIPRIRRQRPARPQPQSLSIWLMFAVVAAIAAVFAAVKPNLDRVTPPVEGSSEEQQKHADEMRAALARDSTSIEAHVGLANVLYDTGNWSEAIIHYRAAVNRDSSQAPILVDLGVCYFNLGDTRHAEQLFELALRRDPHQPVALFNLGIVAEHRKDYRVALQFYHRALQSSPPENMRQPLVDAMTRVQKETGTTAPPLPDSPSAR